MSVCMHGETISCNRCDYRGILDTWRSEAFRQGIEYAKNRAAKAVYSVASGADAVEIEKAIMNIKAPVDAD